MTFNDIFKITKPKWLFVNRVIGFCIKMFWSFIAGTQLSLRNKRHYNFWLCSGFWRLKYSSVDVTIPKTHTVFIFRIEVSSKIRINRRVCMAPKPIKYHHAHRFQNFKFSIIIFFNTKYFPDQIIRILLSGLVTRMELTDKTGRDCTQV